MANKKYSSNEKTESCEGTAWGSYLAGLFEGDGYIYINTNKKKRRNPMFCICFNIKDKPLAEKNIRKDRRRTYSKEKGERDRIKNNNSKKIIINNRINKWKNKNTENRTIRKINRLNK